MALIPPFGRDGLLPPGDYEVTFPELRSSNLVLGPGAPRGILSLRQELAA
jgi:hypothetical protein